MFKLVFLTHFMSPGNLLSVSLKIPEYILSGRDTIFNCSYSDISVSDYSELGIKWYFNSSNTPFLVLTFSFSRLNLDRKSWDPSNISHEV